MEPTTEAGRALFYDWGPDYEPTAVEMTRVIRAIEQQAAAAERARIHGEWRALFARYIEWHGEPEAWDDGPLCLKHAPTVAEFRAALGSAGVEP